MISYKTLLYIGETYGVHDERFINALSSKFKVTTLFRTNNNQIKTLIQKQYDIVVVSPISLDLLKLSHAYTGQKVGICWAVEINNITYKQNEIAFIKNTLKDFKAVIVDADYIAERIREKFQFTGNIQKLYFGCDTSFFFQTKSKNDQDKKARICVTRRSLPLYNNEIIIEALTRVRSQVPLEAMFTSEQKVLNSYHKSLISDAKVKFKFIGEQSVQDMAKMYHESDVYVSAAKSDGISVSLLEAMASGLICIVTDFPTNLEVIKNGVTGFTFKNGDVVSLTNTLEQVLNLSKEEWSSIVRKAQEFIVEFADWQKNSSSVVKWLSESHYAG